MRCGEQIAAGRQRNPWMSVAYLDAFRRRRRLFLLGGAGGGLLQDRFGCYLCWLKDRVL